MMGPPDNEDIARRLCEAAWVRPTPDIRTIAELGHTEHEMFTVQSLVEGGGYRGAEGFFRWLESWREMFGEDWEASVLSTEDLGDERVLVSARMHAQGLGGGVPIDQRMWVVVWVRNGLAIRSEVHTDEARARATTGEG